MFLTMIRTILWILLAGIVSIVGHMVIFNLQTPKSVFSRFSTWEYTRFRI